jgi:hypothetical protein
VTSITPVQQDKRLAETISWRTSGQANRQAERNAQHHRDNRHRQAKHNHGPTHRKTMDAAGLTHLWACLALIQSFGWLIIFATPS